MQGKIIEQWSIQLVVMFLVIVMYLQFRNAAPKSSKHGSTAAPRKFEDSFKFIPLHDQDATRHFEQRGLTPSLRGKVVYYFIQLFLWLWMMISVLCLRLFYYIMIYADLHSKEKSYPKVMQVLQFMYDAEMWLTGISLGLPPTYISVTEVPDVTQLCTINSLSVFCLGLALIYRVVDCPSIFMMKYCWLEDAEYVLISEVNVGEDGNFLFSGINMSNKIQSHCVSVDRDGHSEMRSFYFVGIKYTLTNGSFQPHSCDYVNKEMINKVLFEKGLCESVITQLQREVGQNAFVVNQPAIEHIVMQEAFRPDMIISIVGVANHYMQKVRVFEHRFVYLVVCEAVLLVILVMRVKEKRDAYMNIKRQITVSNNTVLRFCSKVLQRCTVTSLVPSDLIKLELGDLAPCDCILLQGNLVVDESCLTGEAWPVLKTPVDLFDTKNKFVINQSNFLHSGARILEGSCLAYVCRVGGFSAQGQMFRMQICNTNPRCKGHIHNKVFSSLSIGLIIVGIIYLFFLYDARILHTRRLFHSMREMVMLIITYLVPPPVMLFLECYPKWILNKLKKKKITVNSMNRLYQAEGTNVVVFDKVGTLTEAGMSLVKIRPVLNGDFLAAHSFDRMSAQKLSKEIQIAISCCHMAQYSDVGQWCGNSIDVAMAEAIPWVRIDASDFIRKIYNPRISAPIRILRSLPFCQDWLSSAVVIEVVGTFYYVTKGSYERIAAYSSTDSLPSYILETASTYMSNQYYVLGLAIRELPNYTLREVMKAPRASLHRDLTFLGFLLFRNVVKAGAKEVIQKFHGQGFHCIMSTGDHIASAIAIAQKLDLLPAEKHETAKIIVGMVDACGLLWHDLRAKVYLTTHEILALLNENTYLAVTSQAYHMIRNTGVLQPILDRIKVLGRMRCEDKMTHVKDLQSCGFVVAMCGDGWNDYGAMWASHVGIGLASNNVVMRAPIIVSSGAALAEIATIFNYARGLIDLKMHICTSCMYNFVTHVIFGEAHFQNYQFHLSTKLMVGRLLLYPCLSLLCVADQIPFRQTPCKPSPILFFSARFILLMLLYITLYGQLLYFMTHVVLSASKNSIHNNPQTFITIRNILQKRLTPFQWCNYYSLWRQSSYDSAVFLCLDLSNLMLFCSFMYIGIWSCRPRFYHIPYLLIQGGLAGLLYYLVTQGPTTMHCHFLVNCDEKHYWEANNTCMLGPQLLDLFTVIPRDDFMFPSWRTNNHCLPMSDPSDAIMARLRKYDVGSCRGINNCFDPHHQVLILYGVILHNVIGASLCYLVNYFVPKDVSVMQAIVHICRVFKNIRMRIY